jgi:anthranilate phosphoribosyltransferase
MAATSLANGLEIAAGSVDSGRAAATLERWVRVSRDEEASGSGSADG